MLFYPRVQGICDGAGAVILASEDAVNKHGLQPLVRLVGYSVAGVDPTIMGIGPADAIKMMMSKVKMDLKDVDLVEVSDGLSTFKLFCFLILLQECVSHVMNGLR